MEVMAASQISQLKEVAIVVVRYTTLDVTVTMETQSLAKYRQAINAYTYHMMEKKSPRRNMEFWSKRRANLICTYFKIY